MRIMLDVSFPLAEVVAALGGVTCGESECELVHCICTDSREAEHNDLFFPLAECLDDRINHAREAAARGAITVGEAELCPTISVNDGRRALLSLAALYKSRLDCLLHTVGVTGSTGKTTVTRFIRHLLSRSFKVGSTIGNFNNIIGLSLSVLCAPRDTEILVLEMGMNHAGEIDELAKAVEPDVCVITNIGTAHIGNLGSREAIASAKCEIATDACRHLICPEDEPLLYGVDKRQSFALNAPADFCLTESDGVASLSSRYGTIDGIRIALKAEHYRKSLCAAAAVAQLVGQASRELCEGLESVDESECRARILHIGELTVIDDTYNSSYEAAVSMLRFMKDYPPPYTAVLGDMLELGDMSEPLHEALGARAAEVGVELLIAVGKYSKFVVIGATDGGIAPSRVSTYVSAESDKEIANEIISKIRRGTVLVKGSHATELYRIVNAIKDKESRDE